MYLKLFQILQFVFPEHYIYSKQLICIFVMKFTTTYEKPISQLLSKEAGEEFQ